MGLRRGIEALVQKGSMVFAGRYLGAKKSSNYTESARDDTTEHKIAASERETSIDDSMETHEIAEQHSGRIAKRIIGLGFLFILLAVVMSTSKRFSGADSPQCRSVYMYPSYARIDGFDERYTKLAKKYHLYLYREQGKDQGPREDGTIQLDGIPVLFIPGNAGSFKQARSIAAACAYVYFDEPGSIQNPHTKNLDFFTADFNEDLTAFHGRTMLDQAGYLNDAIEYILSLYQSTGSNHDPTPQSVLIVGHSMGGIVARVMPTLKNFRPDSVNSYITLSAPHAVAPVTFDGDMLKIYERITKFWRAQYADSSSSYSQNVSIISITGGVLDSVLPADFTIIEGIVPYSNGFTTYTTTIPELWTPIDHLAIVWCDQLRSILAHILLESVDTRSPFKTRSLDDRMHLYRKMLLTGLEDYTNQDKVLSATPSGLTDTLELSTDFQQVNIDEQLIITSANRQTKPSYYIFTIPKNSDRLQFSVLTSNLSHQVLFCQDGRAVQDEASAYSWTANCISASDDFVKIPRSALDSYSPSESSWGADTAPFEFLSVNLTSLLAYDFIAINTESTNLDEDFFMIGELTTKETKAVISDTPFSVFFNGLFKMRKMLRTSGLVTTLDFTNLYSSIVSYRVRTRSKGWRSRGDTRLFMPLFRQSVEKPFESKWHVNLYQGPQDVNFHNVAPFVELNSTHDKSLRLSFINPPGTETYMDLKVNWPLTVKMLLIRFRLSIAAFTIAFVSLVVAYQFRHYGKTGQFIAFDSALFRVLHRHWVGVLSSLSLLIPLTSLQNSSQSFSSISHKLLACLSGLMSSNSADSAFFLGVRESFMWWLGPVFFMMTISLVYLVYCIMAFIETLAAWLGRKTGINRPAARNSSMSSSSVNYQFYDARQILGALIIILSVLFYVPYQFAFVVLTIVQALFCVKLAVSQRGKDARNLANFNNSVLMLMLFLVPINAPIVVVFMRNFAIKWETPFRSHHNCLAVLPIVLLIESNARSRMPKRATAGKDLTNIVVGWLLHTSLYSVLFGTRNLYWLHHLFNSLCAMLFLQTFA
ncbi:LAME_0A02762g1_1 [Lachancea meyersii CBS 8951]|uniref:GPI inositol-deacylase n=1 Tax=Lachancea meyersii CBS 8951 TaxID=1266667 RepID=A0A1G4IMY0_9SACH|nr:LAME_0A02762g1_1 [Lachancea meyersii CBS 8951]